MHDFEQSSLWQKTLAVQTNVTYQSQREILRQGYLQFRSRVELLIGQINSELPDLTRHDITHVDALWGVASAIAGEKYPLNPAEAFVLGGAFLLHDAAHCRAAFPNGLADLRQTSQWQVAAKARGCDPATLDDSNRAVFQQVLFETLRVLHPIQAEKLPSAVWGTTPSDAMHLLPHDDLREAYGHAIGAIARSHWQSPHELEAIAKRTTTAPVCLSPADWTVDWLKLAVLLRTADALHMDARRAPRFLMQIAPPSNEVSNQHWTFQSKLNALKADTTRQEILITGSPFSQEEQAAWWQAYDTVRMADKELNAAFYLLRDNDRPALAVREVAGIRSPDAFAVHVPTDGWVPVDTEVRISQVHQLVENFGGAKLYGDKPELAVRELLQNALDATHACRKLGGLGDLEGEIEVTLESASKGQHWLHVTDNGIGMSRYVLTHVLLDFGRSLWRSGDLQGEWGTLGATDFEAIGQFGIGFFSVFMLGQQVRITTKRYEAKEGESEHHVLEFTQGIRLRPILRKPDANEKLMRHGTRVSVLVTDAILEKMIGRAPDGCEAMLTGLAPAIDVTLSFRSANSPKKILVTANDWMGISNSDLQNRFRFHFRKAHLSFAEKDLFFSDIFSVEKKLIGRIGTDLGPDAAVGVVKGLYAGRIEGISGLLQCKPQFNLNRENADPDVRLIDISSWAEKHKKELIKLNHLDLLNSKRLAAFGADHKDMILGEIRLHIDSNPVFFGKHELSEWLKNEDEFFIYIRDRANDYIDFRLFHWDDGKFISAPKIFSMDNNRMPEWFETLQGDFSMNLTGRAVDCPMLKTVKNIIDDVWIHSDLNQEDVVIAKLNFADVKRNCLVFRRRK